MFIYTPFEAKEIGWVPKKIACAGHGFLVGIIITFFARPFRFFPDTIRISVYDVGTTKEYIIKEARFGIFTQWPSAVTSTVNAGWHTAQGFIFLDHYIEKGHELVIEASEPTRHPHTLDARGAFVYLK